ncbi:pyridoxal phosphate-dependent transferase [Thelonectria olida]|uniref:Pyridoxal phosphate-dependent transferase n=1 Tax=Thelonectria olida TaxID=1576542 RepID=A0A9P9AUE8_9HYPO|nr:pyridoxal phosphate-dependent transferase [Thelonectria olida]
MASGIAGRPSADAGTNEEKKKKLRDRNRLSQRTFRRRQAEELRELRERVNAEGRPENEQVTALQQENARLRKKLVEVQTKLSRVVANCQLLTTDITKTLDEPASGDDAVQDVEAEMEAPTPGGFSHRRSASLENTAPFPCPHQDEPANLWEAAVVPYRRPSLQDSIAIDEPAQMMIRGEPPARGLDCQQIPNIWTHEYQMGLEPYRNAITATEEVNRILGKEWPQSNSPFSDHIDVLQTLLKDKLNTTMFLPHLQEPTPRLYQTVLTVLAMFNSMTRPDVMAWYARTRFYHIVELTAWQLFPSSGTYRRLHERYRPTPMQIQFPKHPRVIDWIPFPHIRDRLIQLHAANPNIDQIFCDAVSGYVVEAIMSDLILDAPSIRVYIRVTDLITTMSMAPSGQPTEETIMPAPDVQSLFGRPEYATAAFKFLNMNRGASYYKIDPAFFGKYPELYDGASPMMGSGTPLKPDLQARLTWPKPLNSTMVETYRSFIHFSLDAADTIPPGGCRTDTVGASFYHAYLVMAKSISAEKQAKYSFLDDYSEAIHPLLLEAICAGNHTQETGYGHDTYCEQARQRIRSHLGRGDVGIFFVPSGTSANAISIASCLRPHEAVIAASSGHIVTRETGAVEASGHKIINATPDNGKLTPDIIARALDENWHFPHMAKPRMVYISNATEIGTIYTKDELRAIKDLCERRHLLLFLDGARIGAALASKANDMTLSDVLELTDIFWIGGTKNGALLGEAVVVKDPRLASEFEFYVKQHGSLLAKSRVMGVQFAELFRENLYFDLALTANLAAEKLSAGIEEAGFSVHAATQTNQVFAVLPLGLIKRLQAAYTFYVWEKVGHDKAVVRLLTTWATKEREIDGFIGVVREWARFEGHDGPSARL